MKELNDENHIEVCLIKVNGDLYQIDVDHNEEMLYLIEPYASPNESKEQLTFTKALWYHSVLLNDYSIKDVPLFGMWIPRDEYINIIDFHNIDK